MVRPDRPLYVGGFSGQFMGFMAFPIAIFVVGLVVLNWPPIDRSFDSSRSLGTNLLFWAVANLTALYLLFLFLRRALSQYSTRLFEEGVRQYAGIGPVFIPWSEVVEVRRTKGVFELRGASNKVRIDQDFYADPDLLRKALQELVPAGACGRRSLGRPVP